MAGHSKWNNIKNKKGKADAQRAKVFTKISRQIIVAIKEGGADPDTNSKLKEVLVTARDNNVPNDNINRLIKRAQDKSDKDNFEEVNYEGYGPEGIAVFVESLTDNRNRTASEVRHAFDKYGGNLGSTGSVSYMFVRKGIFLIEAEKISDEDELMMLALDNNAEDYISEDGIIEIQTSISDFLIVKEVFKKNSYDFDSSRIEQVPDNYARIEKKDAALNMINLLELLEESDDVQNVWHNWENEDEFEIQ